MNKLKLAIGAVTGGTVILGTALIIGVALAPDKVIPPVIKPTPILPSVPIVKPTPITPSRVIGGMLQGKLLMFEKVLHITTHTTSLGVEVAVITFKHVSDNIWHPGTTDLVEVINPEVLKIINDFRVYQGHS